MKDKLEVNFEKSAKANELLDKPQTPFIIQGMVVEVRKHVGWEAVY